jgi:hypothetical protein
VKYLWREIFIIASDKIKERVNKKNLEILARKILHKNINSKERACFGEM